MLGHELGSPRYLHAHPDETTTPNSARLGAEKTLDSEAAGLSYPATYAPQWGEADDTIQCKEYDTPPRQSRTLRSLAYIASRSGTRGHGTKHVRLKAGCASFRLNTGVYYSRRGRRHFLPSRVLGRALRVFGRC